ncbi:MAG: hypothetical protein IPH15_15775 [Comamonadaceae bacterium]|nr:hypothetical protein [Comamonadaceae bacterium]
MTVYHWLALFVAVNILDALLTLYALRQGASEGEPSDAAGDAPDARPGGAAGRQGRVHHRRGRDAARGFALVAVADGVFAVICVEANSEMRGSSYETA